MTNPRCEVENKTQNKNKCYPITRKPFPSSCYCDNLAHRCDNNNKQKNEKNNSNNLEFRSLLSPSAKFLHTHRLFL